jgi:hypothetical protein
MKSMFRTGLAVCGLVVTLIVSAGAQSPSKAKIPFDFIVGDKTLKAGEYVIKVAGSGSMPELLAFHDANGKPQVVVNGIRMEAVENNGRSRLLFTKYGDRYFLSQIWLVWHSGTESGTGVRQGRLEREVAMDTKHKAQRVSVALAK